MLPSVVACSGFAYLHTQALPLGDTSELYCALFLTLGGLKSKPYWWPVDIKSSQHTVNTQLAQKDASRSVWYPRAMLEETWNWNSQHRRHGVATAG